MQKQMEFFLPLYARVDAPVKPLVVKSLDFGFLQKVIDLLPLSFGKTWSCCKTTALSQTVGLSPSSMQTLRA